MYAIRSYYAERFILRPLRRSDAGLIAMYTSDRRVAEGTRAIPHPLPPGTAENFVSRAMGEKRNRITSYNVCYTKLLRF